MADTDKNILITPNVGSTDEPTIVFTGSDNNPVTLRVLDDGTISFEGSSGQLFSVADNLAGTIFSVNDISGIPSIEVDDTGVIRLAEFTGNVLLGTDVDDGSSKLQVAGDIAVSGTVDGRDLATDGSKLDGIASNANNYTHPTHPGDDFSVDTGPLTGATVVSDIDINVTTDTLGHVTDANGVVSTRTLTLADLGFTGATNANYYTHPSYAGDDINLDTGALTGATVISDLDFNVTTDTQGHVTDANGVVSTRTLTLADLGYTGATNANYYTHPSYAGDDINVDTGALTGATVISDLDFNVTTDGSGHVTDANAAISTRNLTYSDVGAAASSHTHDDRYYTETESHSIFGGYAHSGSDFVDGTLVTTNIPATDASGASFVIEVTGKSYSTEPPFSFIAQGYLYGNTIISTSGVNNGDTRLTYIKAMENGGYLSFWWPRISYWNSFEVRVRDAGGTSNNRVTSIANSSDPSGATKKVTINLAKSWASHNDGSGSGLDADLLDGNHASAFAAASHTHSYLPLSGGTLTGDVTINKTGSAGITINADTDDVTETDLPFVILTQDGGIGHLTFGIDNNNPYIYPNRTNNADQSSDTNQLHIKQKNGTYGKVWHSLNDGSGSGLDADLLDGQHASAFAAASHTHSYLPLSGGSLTGSVVIDTPADYDATSVTSLTSAPINAPDVNVGTSNTFLPFLHQTSLHSSGYRTHMNLGLYKNTSGWGEGETGFYVALGGSDYYPTEYFRMTKGGQIKHSNGYTFWHSGNDGSGSGLDADTLDGLQSTRFMTTSYDHASNWTPTGVGNYVGGWHGPSGGADGYISLGSNTHALNLIIDGDFYARASSANKVWHAGNDGSGSGLDADLLDGYHGSHYLADSAHSFATSGYQKLSNGLIIQWGRATIPHNSYVTVTFPTAFPTAALSMTASFFCANTTDRYSMSAYIISTTSGRLYAGGGGDVATYIAIGY